MKGSDIKLSENIEQNITNKNEVNQNVTNQNEVNQESFQIETNNSFSSYAFFDTGYHNLNYLSMENLQEYVKYPMVYNEILREISKQAYGYNGQYARAIDARQSLSLLSYVLVTHPKGSINASVKKNKKAINTMMRIINHKKTSRDILRKLDIYGIYVGILRDTKASNKSLDLRAGSVESIKRIEGLSLDDNFMIQPLDLDYCKIVGFQNNVAVAAFDMSYFDQWKHNGLVNEIKNFPIEFAKAYREYKKDASSKRWFILDYKRTIALTSRSDIEEAYGRPYGISAFCDMKLQEDYNNSQYKLINELASSIYYLILPEGAKTGECSLNTTQQKEVIKAFKDAIRINSNNSNGAKISTLSLPPNTRIERLSKDSSLLKDTLSDEMIKKISTNLGFASSALNASSEGSSGFAGLQVNLDIISADIFKETELIANEYTRLLNEHIGIKPAEYISVKYLPISNLNKNEMYDKMKDLYMIAGGSRTYLIAASGIDPEDYFSICDEERFDDLDEKYLPHVTSYTSSDSADKENPDNNLEVKKNGRPTKKTEDLSYSGTITKGTGANNVIKPSTK